MTSSQPVALVTGATGSIGQAIVTSLVDLGWSVALIGRNKRKLDDLQDTLKARYPDAQILTELCDVTVPSSISDLVQRWRGPLQVLINNTAVAPKSRHLSLEGIELQFATNVLSYLRMQNAFEPILKSSSPARVIHVASYWAGDLDLDDLQFVRRPYHNHLAYRQSKQANRMLSKAMADRWQGMGVTVNACHPGDVHSRLSHDLGFGGFESAEEAAGTPVFLATDPSVSDLNGCYFERKQVVACPFCAEQDAVDHLLRTCKAYF